jgi:diketogulonate reductase-like aldo/keto reductase
LGYGLFQVPPQDAERCTRDALEVGYRLIDTAQAYGNEQGVGDAIRKSGIDRKDIFLVTKVWITNAGEEKASASIETSLRKLQTDYIDLLLIHQAYGDVFGSWRAMEKAYRTGRVRAIGVSNFQACRFYDFARVVDVKPAVNQLQCCVLCQQNGILPEMERYDTKMMAWGPLGQGSDDLLKSSVLAAIGANYGKSPAQVALRWLIQRGIVAIPKSTHKERMAANFDIFDFALSDADMQAIAALNQQDTGFRNFADPDYLRRIIGMFNL